MTDASRLPPGQHLLTDPQEFPVLDLGRKPDWDPQTYRLKIFGEVEQPVELSYDQFLELPTAAFTADFHCVTTWSRFDIAWRGVAWSEVEKIVQPKSSARFVIQSGLDGYTTNIGIEELRKPNVFIAFELEGKPLPKEHGAPLRMIIPHLYAWKGSKFLSGIEFRTEDKSGFWEVRGYNSHGDPWLEERYS